MFCNDSFNITKVTYNYLLWTLGDGQYEKSVVSGCVRKQNGATSRGVRWPGVAHRPAGVSEHH